MSNQDQAQPLIGSIAVAVGGKIVGKVLDKALDKALNKGLDNVVKRADNPVQPHHKEPIKEEIREEVVKEMGPVLENLTNSEPLWRSKVLWASLGAFGMSIANIVDMYSNGTPDTATNYMLAASAAVGSLGAIYSRIFPSKALGR